MNSRSITQLLVEHYGHKFAEHGACSEGVDWGPNPEDHRLRLDRMLAVTDLGLQPVIRQSLLDVGCGYRSLLDLFNERGLELSYSGIDVCAPMIDFARARHKNHSWLVGDVMDLEGKGRYDYVVCNGVLTQKLGAKIRDMDGFLKEVVAKMFELCRVGVAFNVMTTHVNYMVPNLYYRNPVELLAWCMSELTSRVRLDHAYPMFEYTVYLYREDASGLAYGAHRAGAR